MARPRKLTDEELALAYEMRTGGCRWKRIAAVFGVDPEQLRYAVRWVIRHGIKNPAEAGQEQHVTVRRSGRE